jgi:hypothetical protein
MAAPIIAPNRRLAVVGPPFMKGADVEQVQRALNVEPDQEYGPDTRDAVRNWKFRAGYPAHAVDGELGITGQRRLLGQESLPVPFLKRAEQRTSGAGLLDAFIAGRTWHISTPKYADLSPLEGFGGIFAGAGRRHHIDPRFLVAIATQEGRLGTYKPTAKIFNTFGLGPGRKFESWPANIEEAARILARPGGHYAGAQTIRAIGMIWAPPDAANDPHGLNNSWVKDVAMFYGRLGGRNSADAVVKSAP